MCQNAPSDENFYPLLVATLIIAAIITPAKAQKQETSLLTKKEQRAEQRQEKKQLFETKRINYRHDFRIGNRSWTLTKGATKMGAKVADKKTKQEPKQNQNKT